MEELPPSTSHDAVYPWERQEGESSKAFHAFTLYRDAGHERSLTQIAQKLNVSKQAIGKWSTQWHWVGRCLAWDNYQHRVINHNVLSTLVRQAQTLQRAANTALASITKGDAENMTVAELCLCLKTISSLAEVANGNGSARNEYGFSSELPVPKFEIVTFSKPDDHCWVRRSVDDMDATRAFHIPLEIAPRFREVFPCYPEHHDGFFVIG